MPLIEVKLYDRRVPDAEREKRIIEEMTEALVRATGDEGVRRAHMGGRPGHRADGMGHRRNTGLLTARA